MPTVYPFRAVQFAGGRGDVSAVIAPPYDVLDAQGKAALLAKDARNIVAIDLPHTPAKQLGPPEAYAGAGTAYRARLSDGTLSRQAKPAMFAYRQTFKGADGVKTTRRSGMTCAVETLPFGGRPGGGILPHEETFSGPKEDRLALMKATAAQLSPIFGLFADDAGRATALLHKVMASRPPDQTATTAWGAGGGGESILHESWTIDDDATVKSYRDALAGEDVFIADGHHRYNTALNYIKHLEASGKPLPADHAARRCMMVLVGMSDPGLVIWPTHRVLGGMSGYTFDAFQAAAGHTMKFQPVAGGPAAVDASLRGAGGPDQLRVGVYDFATGRGALAIPASADPLAARFPGKPREWRTLDVAFVQHAIVEDICQPRLNAGKQVTWAFPHTIKEVEEIGRGTETGAGGGRGFAPQLAVVVRPTPLAAVRAVSKAGELMPQKSTFFYPKLATGMWVNPLE
ncbi:MAG: DUF1015 family protein [Phycisphaerales bacterium]